MYIKNIITDGNITDSTLFSKISDITKDILSSDDKLKNNYSMAGLDLKNHKSFDALLSDDDELICFSGLYHRPYWPAGFYRISNRTYVMPKFRTTSYNFLNPANIGPHQIFKHVENMPMTVSPTVKIAFISRENAKAKFYFKKLQREVDYYKDWHISSNMLQLVNSEKQSSYQYVIYKNYDRSSINEFNSITEEEWRNLK
jgi:hypothetical protein